MKTKTTAFNVCVVSGIETIRVPVKWDSSVRAWLKPKVGSTYIWRRKDTGILGGPNVFTGEHLNVEWIPYPLEPLPEQKPEPDACDAEFLAAYGTGRTHSNHELELWSTAWAKARDQKP